MSLTGVVLGSAMAAASALPSLVPRAWPTAAFLCGVCFVVGYALGALVGWAYRYLQLPVPSPRARRAAWVFVGVAVPLLFLAVGFWGRRWQSEQRELLGMEAAVPLVWMVAPFLGLIVAALLLAAGRLVVLVGRQLTTLLARFLPRRVAVLLAVLVTAWLTWYVASGVLVGNALTVADAVFKQGSEGNKPGVTNPQSPDRSGGPKSDVPWSSLGREGRQFIWQGRTAAQIREATGDAGAREPVRVFVPLSAEEDPARRAALAVAELKRMGGFDRRVLAVASGTGSGWIDPKAAAAFELVAHGDAATVSMQYSYLPSWMSFLVDRVRARENAAELITAVRVELDSMPAEERPELYVYGESLGAYSTGSAFTSAEDMSTTTDGALMIGPPSFEPTFLRIQQNREPGSPLWRPRFRDGALARVAVTEEDLTDRSLTWKTDNRIVYLTHPSDPIVAWTDDHSEWLHPRGDDVHPQVRSMPFVGFLQGTFDQFGANATPPGHGHRYDEIVVPAWAEILAPPELPPAEVEAIMRAVEPIEDPR